LKVAVLAGGRSSEHDVSLASAASVLDGLEAGGHHTVPIVIDRAGTWRSADPRGGEAAWRGGEPVAVEPGSGLLGADVAFPVLHGPFGEDGTVQGLLECAEIPYVGAGVLGSAICMDKAIFKRLMAQAGVPQVRHEVVLEREWRNGSDNEGGNRKGSQKGSRKGSGRQRVLERAREIGMPQFVKPARLGSSFGISKVTTEEELPAAIEAALAHDPRALVEAAASGIEIECSVIGNDEPVASEPGEVRAHADWYDYESKYTEGGMDLIVPAPISAAQRERVQRLAAEAFLAGDCSGLARVDFFVTDEGQVLVNELNTIPGFTSTSVFARLFDASGIGYVELLDRLLEYAVERHRSARGHTY
jgi:D-alanine-D-alanine ligase